MTELKTKSEQLQTVQSNLELFQNQVNELIETTTALQKETGEDMSIVLNRLRVHKTSLTQLNPLVRDAQTRFSQISNDYSGIQDAIINGNGIEYLQNLNNQLAGITQGLQYKDIEALNDISNSLGTEISSSIAQEFETRFPGFNLDSLPSNKEALKLLSQVTNTLSQSTRSPVRRRVVALRQPTTAGCPSHDRHHRYPPAFTLHRALPLLQCAALR